MKFTERFARMLSFMRKYTPSQERPATEEPSTEGPFLWLEKTLEGNGRLLDRARLALKHSTTVGSRSASLQEIDRLEYKNKRLLKDNYDRILKTLQGTSLAAWKSEIMAGAVHRATFTSGLISLTISQNSYYTDGCFSIYYKKDLISSTWLPATLARAICHS